MTRMYATLMPLCLLLAACGDDPSNYSAPVGINLKVKGDVPKTTIDDGKNVTTESGNPYGAFVQAARAKLGRDPARITLDRVTLTLGATSTGVTALEQVFAGDATVAFLMNDTNNTFPAGVIPAPTGTGPVAGTATFDSVNGVAATDWTKLLGGNFQVVLSGATAAAFQVKGPEADLQVTLTFSAFP
ncbi:MAG TPA: hypothetical protein VGQ83_24655 [Polyangia bacterium]|jgi:hypothetical protein